MESLSGLPLCYHRPIQDFVIEYSVADFWSICSTDSQWLGSTGVHNKQSIPPEWGGNVQRNTGDFYCINQKQNFDYLMSEMTTARHQMCYNLSKTLSTCNQDNENPCSAQSSDILQGNNWTRSTMIRLIKSRAVITEKRQRCNMHL